MVPAAGILSALPHPLLFLLLLALFPFYSLAQNCSYGYAVRSDPRRLCDCVLSSQDGFTNCRTLADILNALKDQIPSDDCLQLSVDPGTYTLTSYETTLNYSVMISAPSGNVSFTCLSNCMKGSQAVVGGSPLAFESSSVAEARFVVIEGVAFEDCQRPLQFDAINNVVINHCSFRNFTASAVDLFNCQNIDVQNSLFHNCSASSGKAQFRGNSGGLSIGYHTTAHNPTRQPFIHIQSSQFTYNKANLPSVESSTEQISPRERISPALNDYYYFGRGGGMGIFIDEAFTNITTEIEDCLFMGNYAKSFGGGVYLYTDGNETQHNFTIRRCNFTNNMAGTNFGGGLQVSMLVHNLVSPPSRFMISDCHFEGNIATYGGGLSTLQAYGQGAGNMVTVTHSTFHRNTAFSVGSAIIFTSLLSVLNRVKTYNYLTQDCTFTNNTSPGGTFGVGFIHVTLRGENSFINNTGPGLRIFGSLVSVQGNLSFIGNNAESYDGGALYISEFGQVKLYSGAQVDFINNTGRIGSAIVVKVQRSSRVFSELIFNPQCFLLHENSSLAPSEWDDVVIRFHGNRARVGPAVFISHLDHCAWFSVVREGGNDTNFITATFNIGNFTNWPVFKYSDDSNEAIAQVNSTSQDFYFQTEARNMTSSNMTSSNRTVSMWPGQQRRLNLVGIDQLGHPTYFIIRLSDNRSNENLGAFTQAGGGYFGNTSDADIIRFDPGLLPIEPRDVVVNISYGFPNISMEQFNSGEILGIVIDTPYNIRSSETFHFGLKIENCQPGFELKQRAEGDNLLVCACVDSDLIVLTCDEAENVIVLRDSLWAGSDLYPRPAIHSYQCPAPYCSCEIRDQQICETLFYQEDPGSNRQCHGTRRGSLCGECVNGSAVGVLRTNCRNCTSDNYYALGFLVVADVVAVGAVLLLSVKLHRAFPHSLKGLLFYIQTVYYATEFFPASFWDIRQYMLYLSSILGLYFPWDFCLFPGMTALVSFAPRFIPSVTATIVVASTLLILFVCLPREMRTRKYVWHGIWSLVLLLYAPLMHMCVSLLHCPYLPGAEGAEETYRWFLDGGVECFRDPGHVALGLVAIAVLIPLTLLVPALAIFTLVGRSQKVQNNSVAEKLYSALTEGYKEEVRWWGAWDLLRRGLLITLIVALPGRTIAPILILLPGFAMHLFLQPYQKWWQNLIEAAVLMDYILLLLLRSTQTILDNLSSYSGTSVPAQRGSLLAATDQLTWLFFSFFYLPVVFGVCFCVVTVFYHIIRWLVRRYWRPRAPSDSVVVSEESQYSDFSSTTPVTTTELSIPAL